jgi:hypothetical protein
MNPAQQKAAELIEKFKEYAYANTRQDDYSFGRQLQYNAKQCAIIAVDEILEAIDWHDHETPNKEIDFWQEVKKELTI